MNSSTRLLESIQPTPLRSHLFTLFSKHLGSLLAVNDFFILLASAYFTYLGYGLFSSAINLPGILDSELYRLIFVVAIVTPFILHDRRFADFSREGRQPELFHDFLTHFLIFLSVTCAVFLIGQWTHQAPLSWLALWLGSSGLFALAIRIILSTYLHRRNQRSALGEVAAVVGTGPLADRLVPLLKNNAPLFGIFDDNMSDQGDCIYKADSPLDTLISRARLQKLDRIFIAMPVASEGSLLSIVARLRPLGVPIEICGESNDAKIGYIGGCLPVSLVTDRPIQHWSAALKSAKDFVLASIVAVMLLPVFVCIAIAIKISSPGPVLFTQRRHGLNNREFDIYKFRTMRCAPEIAGSGLQQTVRGDARITPVGSFLRKWSLDELPQVFNVLEGTMSMVGPRPHAIDMRTERQLGHEITDAYPHRHRVKPGITGWAQINGYRGATSTVEQLRERVKLDLYYVENWSFLLDFKILLLTFKEVLRATNAF